MFLTGPSYDRHLITTYPRAVFQKHENFHVNTVAVIEGIPGIKKAIRIYHPGYHNREGADFKYEMAELLCKFLNDS